MEKCEDNNDISSAIIAFDTLYTNNHMKILKMLLPFVDSKHQKLLSIYIKWQELIFTMEFFKHCSINLYSANFNNQKSLDTNILITQVLPYCSEKEKELLSQIQKIQNIKHIFDGIQEYLPMIQQFISPQSNESILNGLGNLENQNIIDLLKNFISEDQLSMLSMFMNSDNS